MNNWYFTEANVFRGTPFPLNAASLPFSWSRSLAVGGITLLVALLHVVLLVWFLNRPAPEILTAAKALPMIDIALAAPNSGALLKNPTPVKPVMPAKPDVKQPPQKPKLKPKPKPKLIPKVMQKSLVKPESVEPELTAAVESPPMAAPVQAPATNATAVSGTHANSVSAHSEHSQVKATSASANLNNPEPNYPDDARKNHIEGKVLVKVQVNTEGLCSNIAIKRSSGHKALDDSALATIKKWRFNPAKRGNTAIVSWMYIEHEFNLTNG